MLTSMPGIYNKTFLVLDDTESHRVCHYQGYAQEIGILLRRSESVRWLEKHCYELS